MKSVFVAFLLALTFFCYAQERPEEESVLRAYGDEDAYQVYDAVLPATREMNQQKGSTLLIQQETQPLITASDCSRPTDNYVNIAPAFDQYREVNKKPLSLQSKFKLDRPYELKPTAYFPKSYSRVPLHYLTLSAVGFNESRTVAVFYVSDHCPSCGSGQLYAAQKKNGKWEPMTWLNECGWIS